MCDQSQIQSQNVLNFFSKTHKNTILSKFDSLRKREILCDITLIVDDVHFKAHKALLAVSSDYFTLLFTDEEQVGQSIYRLDGMAAEAFASVLEFIYSGNILVDESSIEQLLEVARSLEINDLVKAHADFQVSRLVTTLSESSVGDSNSSTAATLSKRKRGRPRKYINTLVSPDSALLSQDSVEKEKSNAEPAKPTDDLSVASPQTYELQNPLPRDDDDSDCDPRWNKPRHGKREIRQPAKLKNYRLGDEISELRVLAKNNRRRKCPLPEPYCDDCGKSFKNHLLLKLHQRTHTGKCM